jgi:hypothetical protein
VNNDTEALRQALRRLPVPEPRAEFIDAAFARATSPVHQERTAMRRHYLRELFLSWHLWLGTVLGGAVAATLTVVLLRPAQPPAETAAPLALTLNEARNIDVLVDSERDLKDATIRIVASGSVVLDGFESEHEIGWRADLGKGHNLLTLPIVARRSGAGRLLAVIEHQGRTRRVTINVMVQDAETSRS